MDSMYIGSSDCAALLAGLKTESHGNLLRRFVSNEKPYYNAKASPIDALRTGAILEDRYFLTLPDGYYEQSKAYCSELDILRSSIDFSLWDDGKIIDFDELKTSNFEDFLKLHDADINYIKKKYKNNYNQVQFQLLCTGLDSANIVFLSVYSYDDEVNINRDIQPNDILKFRVERDEEVIDKIRTRSAIFQNLKDYYTKTD